MRSNFDTFVAELSMWENYPDIIILTEISINEYEFNLYELPNYVLMLNANDGYRAAGVAIYVSFNNICLSDHGKINFVSADGVKINFRFS